MVGRMRAKVNQPTGLLSCQRRSVRDEEPEGGEGVGGRRRAALLIEGGTHRR